MTTNRTNRTILPLLGTSVLLAAGTAHAADDKSIEIYGFAMTDAIYDDGRVDPDWVDAFRPSKIAVEDGQFGTDGQTSLSVKQSRFGVKGSMPTADGAAPLDFKLEIDFFGTGADAGKTAVRLRHAYGQWGSLLAGQTNTLFMDGDVFPNTIDYWGPNGMVFYRNVQFRWTPMKTENSHFAVAIERPGNDIDPGAIRLFEVFDDAEVRGKSELPDVTMQYRFGADWGHVQAAGILRDIRYEYRADPSVAWQDGSETGWGLNLSGSFKTFDRDKLHLQVVYGEGIASYMNDGGMDLAPSARFVSTPPALRLDATSVPMLGVMAYYDHYWNDTWSSSIGYSFNEVDNTNFQSPDAYNRGDYASVNLLNTPVPNVMVGVELLWGERSNNDDSSGDNLRVQFSASYRFGVKL